MFRNVVVGMSGGVDSAVSAFLLKQKGFNVLGVFMRNWDEFDEKGHCSGEQDLVDAEFACNRIGIDLRQVNYVKDYWNSVFTAFLEDYEHGLTPNPDILCNKYIKFDLFYKHAIETLQYDAIATGHYARTTYGPYLEHYSTEHSDVRLQIPKDTFKDQTFFLSGIQRSSLRRSMFPLGNLLKTEVKEIARKCGLQKLSTKRESTGICFVGNRDFKEFIREYIKSKPGPFIDIDTGLLVGEHQGVHQWTLGQRCRLHSHLQPYYVAKKDVPTNAIYVAAGHENAALFSDRIHGNSTNWLCDNPFEHAGNQLRCQFRFQHTNPLVDCTVFQGDATDELVILLDKPLRAITPGQYAVFYRHGDCLGSARIVNSMISAKEEEKLKHQLNS